jgi:hypothetical protein
MNSILHFLRFLVCYIQGLDSADAESSDIEIETEIQIEEGESDGGF